MSDKLKVLAGLLVLAVLITLPFWLNAGKSGAAPEIVIAEAAKKAGNCVESKEWMAANHMALLDQWRDVVVREGKHIYVSESGQEFNMSLSSGENSCLGCHTSTAEFCDSCHDYTGVGTLYCWECHIDPSKENK
ncbi:putative sulfite reductase-associated electron transfer protein DsrJ [Desulfobotulus alkaliphilus]|uniref:Putative sulfite reductase-associated electron transfer protein DsrJ n=1 Tax=Desulfobotulus alkaliphilus TaxID=622671 RepID=A0A562R4G4_9BACT|nr:sulfate reduction electron transfer complex DsrMKJOP subunit DsrJ [Desulfobotulus alkaliphilus]TWI63955.1 putative sulfite reductase-associated electron transfer protein DsrJ [Desulfobotulus alkaliphilus]